MMKYLRLSIIIIISNIFIPIRKRPHLYCLVWDNYLLYREAS